MTRRARSPLHVVCQPWPFPPKPGERRHKPLCQWACRGPVRAASFISRRDPRQTAILHPSTKRLGEWQVSIFDADGALGDSIAKTCTDALRARDITPGLWKLVAVE